MGASDRADVERKRTMMGAWLGGLLGGMADPKTYPALSTILDDEPEPEPEELDSEAAHVGAKLWVMWLNK